MVRYSFLVQLSHPLLHAGLSRRIPALPIEPFFLKQTTRKHHYTITESATELGIIASGDDAFLLRLLAWRSILCSHCVACPLCNVADCCSIARSASASRRLSSYTRTMASVSARSASVRSAFAIRPLRYSSRRSSYFFCRVICSSSCKARSFAALSRDSLILPG